MKCVQLEKVDELLHILKLQKAADTIVGGPLIKGVSGGERKRTSIGVELITDPALIFLDEPTTGLDSFTAATIVEVMRDLAMMGKTIITTIHQPNSDCFENFDQLMLMANGKILYMNDANKAVDYFNQIGYPCKLGDNPADFFMTMMSIEALDDYDNDDPDQIQRSKSMLEQQYGEIIDYFVDKYEESELRCDPDQVHPDIRSLDKLLNVKSAGI